MDKLQLKKAKLYIAGLPIQKSILQGFEDWLPEIYKGAVESRKAEFLAGRYCATRASELLGEKLTELKVGKNREPLWPVGFVGSISHSKSYVCAVVAKSEDYSSLGIDLEILIDEKRISVIDKLVTTDNEKEYFKDYELSEKRFFYTVLFSAKETLYKALYPFCQEYFGFQEAELISLNTGEQEIVLGLKTQRESLQKYHTEYKITYTQYDNNIITYLATKLQILPGT